MKALGSMCLLAVLFLCGFEVKYSTAQTERATFTKFIEDRCFKLSQDEHKEMVYGQKYPLAQTLETFLYLVEKYELANPEKKMKEVAAMLLRNYTIQNQQVQSQTFLVVNPLGSNFESWEKQWKNLLSDVKLTEEEINPFDDHEICSLYFILSHTVNNTAWPEEEFYSAPSVGNGDSLKADEEKKTHFPREQGVVSIEMTKHAVALGRVIAGIFLGLSKDNLKSKLIDLVKGGDAYNLPNNLKDSEVDLFYFLTLSDILVLATWVPEKPKSMSKQIGENGYWRSFQTTEKQSTLNGDGSAPEICPNVYKLGINETSFYTYSLMRGGIDGVILGNLVHDDRDLSDVRLSQLLRMYYTKTGIPLSDRTQDPLSFCQRRELLAQFEKNIQQELGNSVIIFGETYAKEDQIQNRVTKALNNLKSIQDVQNVLRYDLTDVCTDISPAVDPRTLPCETPSDVIAVIDTSDPGFLDRQRTILGYLANNLKLWHQGSKMTVLLDSRNDTTGLGLEELLPETSCSSCVACNIIQREIETSGQHTEKDIVIQSVDKFLQDKKDSESALNGVAGKVVIYFNYAQTEESTSLLEKALVNLRLRHHDTAFFAVGQNKEVLQKYVSDKDQNAIVAIDKLKTVANTLSERICLSPAALQYSECEKPKDESSFYYEGFVTPNTRQHWSMNPKYFLKSYKTKLFFEEMNGNGNIKVCYNRASAPELSENNCKETNSSSRRFNFPDRNPCKGFNVITCGEMRLTVIGIEKKNGNGNGGATERTPCQDKDDKKCKTIDQIRFKVWHEGIRCSGCSSVASTASVMTIAFLFYFFLARNTQH